MITSASRRSNRLWSGLKRVPGSVDERSPSAQNLPSEIVTACTRRRGGAGASGSIYWSVDMFGFGGSWWSWLIWGGIAVIAWALISGQNLLAGLTG